MTAALVAGAASPSARLPLPSGKGASPDGRKRREAEYYAAKPSSLRPAGPSGIERASDLET